jgi:cell division transport system permease protein
MAILGVALVLFILGMLGWLVINASKLESYFKGSVQVNAFVRDGSPQKEVDLVKKAITAKPYARNVEYTTKEAARAKFIGDGNEDWNKVLDYNPLPASIDFYLEPEYVNKDSIEKIKQFIEQSNVVNHVSYPKTIVHQMNDNLRKVSIILALISIVLIIVVIVLIDNTVRLAMFSNRFLIKTMQMVGATRWFISKPFDQRALINGLISGVLAVIGLLLVKSAAEASVPELKALNNPMLLVLLMFSMIIGGILISLVSTHRSVIKYLKVTVDDLY